MNVDQINKWLTLVANFGVIAGIVFLSYEIRQSNLVAIASNDIALRESFASQNESIYGDPRMAELLFKARDPNAQFNDVESEMLGFYIGRLFNTWGAIERAHRTGLTSSEALDAAIDDVRWTVETYPALSYFIEDMVKSYPAQIDSVIYQKAGELVEDD